MIDPLTPSSATSAPFSANSLASAFGSMSLGTGTTASTTYSGLSTPPPPGAADKPSFAPPGPTPFNTEAVIGKIRRGTCKVRTLSSRLLV